MSAPSFSNGAPSVRPRVLVVEADLTAVFVLRHLFALAGYDVDCAASPNEGLRLLNRHRYAVVIIDCELLRGGHGEGLYLAAHARHRYPTACTVMLMPRGAVLSGDEVQYAGVDICQSKPVDLGTLMADVARVIGRHSVATPGVPGASSAPGSVEGP